MAVAVAFFTLFTFLMAGMWSMISLRGLESSLSSPRIDPTSIAPGVSGVINSVYLTVIGIAGCAFASLFLAVATDASDHKSDGEQMDERESE